MTPEQIEKEVERNSQKYLEDNEFCEDDGFYDEDEFE